MVTDPRDALDANFELGRRVELAGRALDAVELSPLRTDWAKRSAFASAVTPSRPNRSFADVSPTKPLKRSSRGGGLGSLSASSTVPSGRNSSLDMNRKDVVKQAKPSRDERLESPRCKPRPVSNKGSGGSRAFVPWCR